MVGRAHRPVLIRRDQDVAQEVVGLLPESLVRIARDRDGIEKLALVHSVRVQKAVG